MNLEMTRELVSYNTWANNRMLDAVSSLGAEQFTRHLGGSYPSVQATLTHILWAEWLWLERWHDQSPMEVFDPQEFPSPADIRGRWQAVQAGQRQFLSSLSEHQLQRVGRYRNRKGEVWEYVLWRQLYHTFNHSSYHRGQVTNMLRLLGASPVSMDFLVYWDEGR